QGARLRLADSEAAFRLMTENATDLIVRLTPDGVLRYVSPASWTLIGRSPHDLLGTSLVHLLHPDDRHLLEDGLARMVAGRRPTTIVARVLHRDGHWLWFETSARPISDPDSGAVCEFQAASRDVTERVSAVEALRASELDVRALAEHRARLARLQEGLRRVATAVARGAEPEEIFALVARETGGVMDARAALIGRFAGREARVVGAWAEDERLTAALVEQGVTMPLEPGSPAVLARVARTGAPARVSDYRAIRDHFAPALAALGVRSGVGAPIRVGGQVWGALLALSTRQEELPPDTEERLSAFAELIELAVESSETREELRRRATYDALTGLMNHYAFQDALAREVEAARRDDRPLSLVLADVDHLRQVNELYGHDAADQALAEVAVRLSSLRRPGDVLARLSGDDFAWLMPGTELEEAVVLAGRWRAAVSEHTLARVGARTISAGVAGLAQAGNAHRLVRLAEGARGWAKANGRNLVVGYDPEVVRELTGEERAERARREQGLAALGALARAVDAKDQSTREHSERVAALAESLSLLLGWSVRRASDLRDAALMHDVGKIGVPDAILFKQESLTDAEFTAIKGHASLGGEITSEVLSEEQVSWIRSHHERWDGRGYPDGLGGVQIPDGARIICVADAFDVMVNIRTYKEPVAPDAALDECVRCAATQFSPDVVGALRTLLEVSGPSGGPPQRSR
ncbi:MAG: hypothetical protein QOK40_862, partial [Miltoncostaeaceae bacterium]|nr:hypothetical protein [Miltoncostaeaceae bacterium]